MANFAGEMMGGFGGAMEDLSQGYLGKNKQPQHYPSMSTARPDEERELGMQSRMMQGEYANLLRAQLAGRGPSLAQKQLVAGRDAAVQGATAAAAGARGANVALAGRSAAQGGARAIMGAGRDAAMLRAQEQLSAQGQFGNLAGAMRGQDIQSRQLSSLEEQAKLNAQIAYMNAQAKISEGEAERGQKAYGGILTAAGGLVSDPVAKEQVMPAGAWRPPAEGMPASQTFTPEQLRTLSGQQGLQAPPPAPGTSQNYMDPYAIDRSMMDARQAFQNPYAMGSGQVPEEKKSGGGLGSALMGAGGAVSGNFGAPSDIRSKAKAEPAGSFVGKALRALSGEEKQLAPAERDHLTASLLRHEEARLAALKDTLAQQRDQERMDRILRGEEPDVVTLGEGNVKQEFSEPLPMHEQMRLNTQFPQGRPAYHPPSDPYAKQGARPYSDPVTKKAEMPVVRQPDTQSLDAAHARQGQSPDLLGEAAKVQPYTFEYKDEIADAEGLPKHTRLTGAMANRGVPGNLEENSLYAPAVKYGADGLARVDDRQVSMTNLAVNSELARNQISQKQRLDALEAALLKESGSVRNASSPTPAPASGAQGDAPPAPRKRAGGPSYPGDEFPLSESLLRMTENDQENNARIGFERQFSPGRYDKFETAPLKRPVLTGDRAQPDVSDVDSVTSDLSAELNMVKDPKERKAMIRKAYNVLGGAAHVEGSGVNKPPSPRFLGKALKERGAKVSDKEIKDALRQEYTL